MNWSRVIKPTNWRQKPMKESKLSRLDKIKLGALTISLGAHLAFIISSSTFLIPGVLVPPSPPEHLFHVKIAREETVVAPQPPKPSARLPEETFRFESPTATKNIESFLQKEQEASKDKKEVILNDKMDTANDVKDDIDVIQAQNPKNYHALRNKVERPTSSLTDAIALNQQDLIDDADEVVSNEAVYKDFVDKMPGFTPS